MYIFFSLAWRSSRLVLTCKYFDYIKLHINWFSIFQLLGFWGSHWEGLEPCTSALTPAASSSSACCYSRGLSALSWAPVPPPSRLRQCTLCWLSSRRFVAAACSSSVPGWGRVFLQSLTHLSHTQHPPPRIWPPRTPRYFSCVRYRLYETRREKIHSLQATPHSCMGMVVRAYQPRRFRQVNTTARTRRDRRSRPPTPNRIHNHNRLLSGLLSERKGRNCHFITHVIDFVQGNDNFLVILKLRIAMITIQNFILVLR